MPFSRVPLCEGAPFSSLVTCDVSLCDVLSCVHTPEGTRCCFGELSSDMTGIAAGFRGMSRGCCSGCPARLMGKGITVSIVGKGVASRRLWPGFSLEG